MADICLVHCRDDQPQRHDRRCVTAARTAGGADGDWYDDVPHIIYRAGSNGIDIEVLRHHTVSVSNLQSIPVSQTDEGMVISWTPGLIQLNN